MVLQVLAHTRHIADHGDIEAPQLGGRPYSREHEQLWRSDSASAQYDLALRPLLGAVVAVLKADDRSALSLKINAERVRVSFDSEIAARHDWMQKCSRRAVPLAV